MLVIGCYASITINMSIEERLIFLISGSTLHCFMPNAKFPHEINSYF
uniref:Uncharacterized protein n=1 Tax=Rhizophora mucronata TaxID=61149 RepID=A0A2P2QC67_RHIMU